MIPIVQGDFNVPLKLNGSVTSWERITWKEYSESSSTERLRDVYVFPTDMLYRLVLTNGNAKLISYVCIKNNFPEQKSIFNITVEWNGVYHSGNCDAIRVRIINF